MSDKIAFEDKVFKIKQNLYDKVYTMTRYGSYTGIIQQMRKDIELLLIVIEGNSTIEDLNKKADISQDQLNRIEEAVAELLDKSVENNDKTLESDGCICGDADRKRNGCCRNCGGLIE